MTLSDSRGLALDGSVACITGGANGIGRACVLALAAEGVTVVSLDQDEEAAAEVVALAGSLPGEVVTVTGDVRRAADIEAAVAAADARGGLDILVNNVGGLLGTRSTPTLEVEEQDFIDVADFNLRPVFLGSTIAARHMIDRGHPGSIINVSASLAFRCSPWLAAYAAAKAAVNQLTQTLAVELAPHGIRVNGIAPSFTETPASGRLANDLQSVTAAAIPLGRVAHPEDMAGVVLFLASHLSGFVTGQTILVDGGLLCTTLRPHRALTPQAAAVLAGR